jgi:hypothetical protein
MVNPTIDRKTPGFRVYSCALAQTRAIYPDESQLLRSIPIDELGYVGKAKHNPSSKNSADDTVEHDGIAKAKVKTNAEDRERDDERPAGGHFASFQPLRVRGHCYDRNSAGLG